MNKDKKSLVTKADRSLINHVHRAESYQKSAVEAALYGNRRR